VRLPWVEDGSIWDGADMWATLEQSRDYIVGLYRDAWANAAAMLRSLGWAKATGPAVALTVTSR
jgi:hypothetical protein